MGWGMEGRLHKLFKGVVQKELLEKDYAVYVEPSEPPLERLWWRSYRPDVLGIIADKSTFQLALAECETAPNRTRILAKTSQSRQTLALQKQLNERHVARSLLILPPPEIGSNQLFGDTEMLGDMGRKSKGRNSL
jgi:hypothetical protein